VKNNNLNNPNDPNNAKLAKLRISDPQRGITQARPSVKRGPQVPKSSKRP
jgi:hypothetical protein